MEENHLMDEIEPDACLTLNEKRRASMCKLVNDITSLFPIHDLNLRRSTKKYELGVVRNLSGEGAHFG